MTIGIVGYSAVVDSYPLGPKLMRDLEAALQDAPHVSVENFTWSPVHVVQRFQDGELERPDRIVLVGLAAESAAPGTVAAYRWRGGHQPEAKVQERVYEAVTGIVDLENTLMIGSYFDVWPSECFTVEADLAPDTFGRLVMAENEGRASPEKLEIELGYAPDKIREKLVAQVTTLAMKGVDAQNSTVTDKTADMLCPVRSFAETHVANAAGG
ncbi:hypothetical protein ATO11_18620 [Pseudaestuariivita atlantica]|uniref:Uncharacterized protein n=1 Tax=Pseudaestuariivita atlantica TaxID=1317121 RepID=A0A0L1JKB4_9RHOB|nr:hypothetical protein ATO11_18620 [Pseudaestuariivita atlantica]